MWRNQRHLTNPIVAMHQAISSYLQIHNKKVDEFVEYIKKNSIKDGDSFIQNKFETEIALLIIESKLKTFLSFKKEKYFLILNLFLK
jgi:hypothetical protein